VTYPSGVFAFYRAVNVALWGVTAMLGAWVWSYGNMALSQSSWLFLVLAWLVVGLLVVLTPNLFKLGDLRWSGGTEVGWNWQPATDSINIGFPSQSVRVQCIWRSHSRMLLTIRLSSPVGFIFLRQTAWLWMKADARPDQWLALCRSLRAHAQT
jgi:hypothetical protein